MAKLPIYCDTQLLDFVEFAFDLDFDSSRPLQSTDANQSYLCLVFLRGQILTGENEFGAIYEVFDSKPFNM